MAKPKPRYKVGSVIEIPIFRQEACFDRACDEAFRYAVRAFAIDDDGNSINVKGWDRTNCSIAIRFLNYRRSGGGEHLYTFEGEVEKF